MIPFLYGPRGESVPVNFIASSAITFVNFTAFDSIVPKYVNVLCRFSGTAATHTIHVGLYSMNAGTLSTFNTGSGTISFNGVSNGWAPLLLASTTLTITPGYYWAAFYPATTSGTSLSLRGHTITTGTVIPPGIFYMGSMTGTTAALPGSMATTNLDTTSAAAYNAPMVLITS